MSHLVVVTQCVYTFHRHISNLPQPRGWERKIAEGPPCVVLASPGFLQNGPSRELLELWAPDPRNGLIITGYSIEGTLARVSGSWNGTHLHRLACSPMYRIVEMSLVAFRFDV